MCDAMTVVIVPSISLLALTGICAWLAFIASVKKRRGKSNVTDEGRRDDARLTAFERAHLWQVIANGLIANSDAELRLLRARARARLFLSADTAFVVVLLLVFRTSAHCS
jgi:hypothetical protein